MTFPVSVDLPMRAFVVLTNGKNGTIGRQIPFKVLPMVLLVMPLVPMVPMGTNGTNVTNVWQQIMQTNYSMGKSTNAGMGIFYKQTLKAVGGV